MTKDQLIAWYGKEDPAICDRLAGALWEQVEREGTVSLRPDWWLLVTKNYRPDYDQG